MNPSAIPLCPVLYPSLKEFDDFRTLVETLDRRYKKEFGMVKVRPRPPGNRIEGNSSTPLFVAFIAPDDLFRSSRRRAGFRERRTTTSDWKDCW